MENFVCIFSLFLYKNAVVFIYLYTFIYIFISFSFVVVPVNCANSAVTQVAGDWSCLINPKSNKKDGKVSAKTKFCLCVYVWGGGGGLLSLKHRFYPSWALRSSGS